jgi:putative transposase
MICRFHHISRQAYYKRRLATLAAQHNQRFSHGQRQWLLHHINTLRRRLPKLGGDKLLHELRKIAGHSVMGRNRFFAFLRLNNLLIKRKAKTAITTNSHHRFHVYQNELPPLEQITRPNQAFVADITYLRLVSSAMGEPEFAYLALVTDLYARKIVGWDLSTSLCTSGARRALQMALTNVDDLSQLIHHSDRGIQYCSQEYLAQLPSATISMANAGNPYENAVAERINGILKSEFYLDATFPSFAAARQAVAEAITIYNNERPHRSLNFLTPSQRYAA